MDRGLIERMVGAGVLVLALVLFAPALLDGGGDKDPSVTGDSGISTTVIVLNAPLDASQSSSPSADTTSERWVGLPAISAKSKPVSPARDPAIVTKPAVTKSGAPTGYAVQIGSFSERANAEKYALGVRDEGFEVFIMRAAASSGPVYRVHAGPRSTRTAAEYLAGMLTAPGRSAMVVDLGGQGN